MMMNRWFHNRREGLKSVWAKDGLDWLGMLTVCTRLYVILVSTSSMNSLVCPYPFASGPKGADGQRSGKMQTDSLRSRTTETTLLPDHSARREQLQLYAEYIPNVPNRDLNVKVNIT
jgi:hypothetical protein